MPGVVFCLVFLLGGGHHRMQGNHGQIALASEITFWIVDIRDTTRHTSCKVTAGFAQYNNGAACHVFATVIASTFDNRYRAGVTHSETLACNAVEECFASDRTVQQGVTADDVLYCATTELGVRTHDDTTARQTLADIIVTFANQIQGNTMCEESASRLACGTLQLDVDRVVRQTFVAVFLRDLTRQHRANGTVDVFDGRNERDFFAIVDCRFRLRDQLIVQGFFQSMVLDFGVIARNTFCHWRLIEHAAEIQTLGFPVRDCFRLVEQIGTTDQFVECTNTQLRHDLTCFFCDEEEVVNHVLWLAGELGS